MHNSRQAAYYWHRCEQQRNHELRLRAGIVQRKNPRMLALLPMSRKTGEMWLAGCVMPSQDWLDEIEEALDRIA